MYLHLGQSIVVPYRDIIGIFDMDNSTSSHLTRTFLGRAEKAGRVESIGEDIPKSFVLCGKKTADSQVYLSQLSSATLLKRAESNLFE